MSRWQGAPLDCGALQVQAVVGCSTTASSHQAPPVQCESALHSRQKPVTQCPLPHSRSAVHMEPLGLGQRHLPYVWSMTSGLLSQKRLLSPGALHWSSVRHSRQAPRAHTPLAHWLSRSQAALMAMSGLGCVVVVGGGGGERRVLGT